MLKARIAASSRARVAPVGERGRDRLERCRLGDHTVPTCPAPALARVMGELGGFLEFARAPTPQRDLRERVGDYHEVYEIPGRQHPMLHHLV